MNDNDGSAPSIDVVRKLALALHKARAPRRQRQVAVYNDAEGQEDTASGRPYATP